MSQINALSTHGGASRQEAALKRLAVIALLSIALGFAMQGLILAGKVAGGGNLPGAAILVDLAQGVTWSFLICAGVGIGTSVARARAVIGGIIAMICAPIAIAAAKSSQKVVAGLIGAADQPAAMSLATISVLRAIEYGILGWLLTRLVLRTETRPLPYLAAGSTVGALFGGAIAMLAYQASVGNGLAPALPQIVASVINEVVFPIGCATVIFVGQMVARNLALISGARAEMERMAS